MCECARMCAIIRASLRLLACAHTHTHTHISRLQTAAHLPAVSVLALKVSACVCAPCSQVSRHNLIARNYCIRCALHRRRYDDRTCVCVCVCSGRVAHTSESSNTVVRFSPGIYTQMQCHYYSATDNTDVVTTESSVWRVR